MHVSFSTLNRLGHIDGYMIHNFNSCYGNTFYCIVYFIYFSKLDSLASIEKRTGIVLILLPDPNGYKTGRLASFYVLGK